MSHRSRLAGFVAAAALAISAVTFFAVSPANAVVTGSLADNGNGGLVVTYSPSPGTSQNAINLEIYPSTSSCGNFNDTLAVISSDPQAPAQSQIAASPATLAVGSTAYALNGGAQPFTLANSAYLFCLYDGPSLMSSLTMTIGQATPTTTAAPTTTATAADPVAPAFTG